MNRLRFNPRNIIIGAGMPPSRKKGLSMWPGVPIFSSFPILMKTLFILCLFLVPGILSAQKNWTVQQSNSWFSQQPWLVGCNYIPYNAINELEMWQSETFDSARIDLELGWAENIGMNTLRVFLHDLLWYQDAPGFEKRLNRFLAICAKHHIRPMLVL